MSLVKGSADHKQHLNLSVHAYNIITHDMYNFFHSDSMSGFINAIFSRYYEYADASVSLALMKKEENLRGLLENRVSPSDLDQIVSPLLQQELQKLMTKTSSYGTGSMLKIRLNNENFAFLYPEDQPDEKRFHFPENRYYKNVGQYLKAVIEEYASKSFFEREEIFFRETIELIQNCVKNGKLLRLHFQNGVYDMKPYGVYGDREQEYHYLAGISSPAGVPFEDDQITSVRLAQILDIQTRSYRSGRLTNDQKKKIQQQIRSSGIQFISQDAPEEIVVYMTKEGVRKYRKMLHLRPLLVKKEDYEDHSIYYFHCTQLQARFYLFRLGGDTYVLKPRALREALKERYEAACEMYKREETWYLE